MKDSSSCDDGDLRDGIPSDAQRMRQNDESAPAGASECRRGSAAERGCGSRSAGEAARMAGPPGQRWGKPMNPILPMNPMTAQAVAIHCGWREPRDELVRATRITKNDFLDVGIAGLQDHGHDGVCDLIR